MTFGTTIGRTRTEIRSTVETFPSVVSAWGFGSHFRGEAFDDVDVLVILDCSRDAIVRLSNNLRVAFVELGGNLGVKFDLLILTPTEFALRPLRDMDQLTSIYERRAIV